MVKAWQSITQASQKWKHMQIEDTCEEAAPLRLRSPVSVHAPPSGGGVSPPPLTDCGWSDAGTGWQRHLRAPNWVRKPKGLGGPVFCYKPGDSLWMTMPSGLFMCVDNCDGLLEVAAASHHTKLLRTCFSSWRCRTSVSKTWKYKMALFGSSGDDSTAADSCVSSWDAYASAEAERFTSSDAMLCASHD